MQNVQQRINFRDNDDKWKEYAFQKVKEEIIKEKIIIYKTIIGQWAKTTETIIGGSPHAEPNYLGDYEVYEKDNIS